MPRQNEPLVNPTWEQLVERDPLISFSWYLSGRVYLVRELGTEVIVNLDAAFLETGVDMGRFVRAEGLMWFWTLGAYEVVRTMCQASGCFAPELSRQLESVKRDLAQVRMPAAKMEEPGKRIPVPSNRSPGSLDQVSRDLLVGNPMKEMISARGLLKRFDEVMGSIKPADVLRAHEDSYEREA